MKGSRIIAWVALLLLLTLGWILYSLWGPAVSLFEKKYFYVSTQGTAETVAQQLRSENVLSSDYWFLLVSGQLKLEKIKAGRYQLRPGMSVIQLVRMFRNGQQSYVKLSIVKERTLHGLAGKIGNRTDTQIDSASLLAFLSNNDSLQRFGVDSNTVLSIVMPYTYSIGWAETPGQMLHRMHTRYLQFWDSTRLKKASAKGLTPLQVSILASIVEEETNRTDDRFKIASTYLNRLRIGMKLQADPTVKYVTRNFSLNRIFYGHLALVSPYNTYLNKGLPPGPICTPSINAIEAVLDAPETNYLFFVASYAFDGTTLFSSSYAEHQQYVKRFHQEQIRRSKNP
ncbi:MAG: endolytic transglycosylase MltG [Sphingomonadales bacterium]